MDSLPRIAIGPLEGSCVSVIEPNVSHDLLAEIGRGLEHAATNAVAGDQT